MQNTMLTLLATAFIVTATVQIADAAQKVRKMQRAPAATSEQFRNSNAFWQQPAGESNWSRYSGGYSAPAGR